jgi:hypothetical protein
MLIRGLQQPSGRGVRTRFGSEISMEELVNPL